MSVLEARATTAIGGARLFLHRLRFDPWPPLTMLLLIAATCFLFAALPRLSNSVSDDGLRYMVEHAPLQERNARALETARIGGPITKVEASARRAQQALPGPLERLVEGRSFVARSPRYLLDSDVEARIPGATTAGLAPRAIARYLTVRAQSGVLPHVRLVRGRFPRPSAARVRARIRRTVFFNQASEVSWTRRVPLLEVALSTQTARLLRLRLGDGVTFVPDIIDLAVQRVAIRSEQPLAVKVVGLFAVKDPQAPYWFGDPTLGAPDVRQTQDLEQREVFGQALVSASQYPTLLAATKPLPLAYEYRYLLDPDRFDAGSLGGIRDAVARIGSRYASAGPLDERVEVGLGPVLQRYASARAQAATLLAVAAIGLFACALANIGLLGALTYDRRRRETGVSRVRGASPVNVLAVQGLEALLIAAPAGLVGWAAAELAIDARGNAVSAWLVLAVVAATVVLLVGAIAGVARRSLGPESRDDVVVARPSARRLVLEGLVALAALLGVYLLRRRGLESTSTGFDPYLAAVPVLLGLACGLVALRLYPLPIAAAAKLARRTRGLNLHLGLSRAARQSDIGSAPLLVLVLALAIVCFSAAMVSTLDAGQSRTAWRTVGGELRLDAPEDASFSPGLIARLDARGQVARAYVQDAGVGAPGQATTLLALDLDDYQRIVAGTPAAVRFRSELRSPPIPGLVPALVSTDWPSTGAFQINLPHGGVNIFTIGDQATFAGIPPGVPFAVVPRQALEQAAGEPIAPNRLYLRGVSEAAARSAVEHAMPGTQVSSHSAVVRSLHASPLVGNVFRWFQIAVVLAALYAAVAVALMALIAARSRSRDLALVRTMGASPRDALSLAAVELTPLVAAALLLGIALGLAIPHLIAPGLDLTFFTGTGSNPVVTPWLAPFGSAVGLVVLVAATVVVVGIRTQRAGLDRVLRIGER